MTGVYCLTDDVVYEHFLAHIKSFRKFNPNLLFTVIKFDDWRDRINSLTAEYNIKIWEPEHINDVYKIVQKLYPVN